ncbi:TonB family protein [Hydrogenimonas sp.]
MTGVIAVSGRFFYQEVHRAEKKREKSEIRVETGRGKWLFMAIFLLSALLHLWMLHHRVDVTRPIEVSQASPSVTRIRLREVSLPKQPAPEPVRRSLPKPKPEALEKTVKPMPVKKRVPVRKMRKKRVSPVKKSAPAKAATVPVKKRMPKQAAAKAPAEKPVTKAVKPRPVAPSPAKISEMKNAYLAELLGAIESRKFYPKIAKRRGMEGVVKVRFVLRKDGKIEKVAIAEGSGYGVLDRAALKTVASIGTFKPIPEVLKKERWEIVAPIRYQIETR